MTFQVFKELPAGRTIRDTRVDWAAAKAALLANPGDWVLMAENVSGSTPTQLRRGENKNFRGEELSDFEFTTRRPSREGVDEPLLPRRTNIYGRYTGA